MWLMLAWEGMRPASCMPDACFCEAIGSGLVRQPVNTASSAAFLLAAWWAFAGARAGEARAFRRTYALSLAGIGAGSALYHASLTFWAQFLDVFGMYMLVTAVVLYGAARAWRLPPRAAIAACFGALLVLAVLLVTAPSLRRYLFAALVLTAVAVELRGRRAAAAPRRRARWLVAALALLGTGFALWVADITGMWCAPHSLLQGHALWHLLGAASAVALLRYYAAPPARPGAAAAVGR